MNKEIKQKWVDALRSGKYKQGIGSLKDGNKYCCLGVLCSVVKAKRWVGKTYPTDSVIRRAELSSYNPLVRTGLQECHLTSLNDSGTSFAEIADLIEKQL